MLSKNIDQIGKETKQIRTQPVEKLQRSMKKLGASTKTTEKSMVNMGNALKVIGTIATGVALRGIVGISNEFEKARSRVMRFGGTTEEQTELFNKLRMAAIRTGTEINSFTSLFSKFSLATKRFNLSTDQVIRSIEGLTIALNDAGEQGDRFRDVIGTILEVLQRAEDPSGPLISLFKTGEAEGLLDDLIKEYARLLDIDIAKWAQQGASNLELLNRLFRGGRFDRSVFLESLLNVTSDLVDQGPQINTIERSWASFRGALSDIVANLFKTSGALDTVTDAIRNMTKFAQENRKVIEALLYILAGIAAAAALTGIAFLFGKIAAAVTATTRAIAGLARAIHGSESLRALLGIGPRAQEGVPARTTLSNRTYGFIGDAFDDQYTGDEHPVTGPYNYPPGDRRTIGQRRVAEFPELGVEAEKIRRAIQSVHSSLTAIDFDEVIQHGNVDHLIGVLEGLNGQITRLGVTSSAALGLLPELNKDFEATNFVVREALADASIVQVGRRLETFFDQVAGDIRPLSDLQGVLDGATTALSDIEIRFEDILDDAPGASQALEEMRKTIKDLGDDAKVFTENRRIRTARGTAEDAIEELRRSRASVRTGGATTGKRGTLAQAAARGRAELERLQFQMAIITDEAGKQGFEYRRLEEVFQQLAREVKLNEDQYFKLSKVFDLQAKRINTLLKEYRAIGTEVLENVLGGIVDIVNGVISKLTQIVESQGRKLRASQNIFAKAFETFINKLLEYTKNFEKAINRLISGDPQTRVIAGQQAVAKTAEELGKSINNEIAKQTGADDPVAQQLEMVGELDESIKVPQTEEEYRKFVREESGYTPTIEEDPNYVGSRIPGTPNAPDVLQQPNVQTGRPKQVTYFPDSLVQPADPTFKQAGVEVNNELENVAKNIGGFAETLAETAVAAGPAALKMVAVQVALQVLVQLFERLLVHSKGLAEGLEALFVIFDVIIDVIAQALAPVFDLLGYWLGVTAVQYTIYAGTLVVFVNALFYAIEVLTAGLVSLNRVSLDFDFADDVKELTPGQTPEDENRNNIQEIKINTDRLVELENEFLRAALAQQFALNELQRVFEGQDAVTILEIPNLQEQRQLLEDQHRRDRERAQRELAETFQKRKNIVDEGKVLKAQMKNQNRWLEIMENVGEKFDKISEQFAPAKERSTARKILGGLIVGGAAVAGGIFGGPLGVGVGLTGGAVLDSLIPDFQRRAAIRNNQAFAAPPGFEGLSFVPTPEVNVDTPELARQFGQLGGVGGGSSVRSNVRGEQQQQNMQVSVTIDRDAMERYLASSEGEQIILNQIRVNSDDIREIVA